MSVGWDDALHEASNVTRYRAVAAGFGVGEGAAVGVGETGDEPPHPISAIKANEGKTPERSIFNRMPLERRRTGGYSPCLS
jgi:hypothetical protein